MNRLLKIVLVAVMLGGIALAARSQAKMFLDPAAEVASAQAPAKKSLFERLGGVYPLAVVVDDFVDRLYVNEAINANPKVKESRDRTPKAGLKFLVTALVCELCGGPYKYHGRSMVESHKNLGINQKEWDAMVADFKSTLDKFKVPAAEQKELLDIVETSKKDIIIAK